MNIKNENGITLVALVITIMVMLILATVTISSTVGEDKIIEQTEAGVIKASEREVEEALEVKLLLKEKEEIRKGHLNGLTIGDLTTDNIVTSKTSEEINGKNYNVYKIDISKLDIKGDYGKGTSNDYFTVQVELNGSTETKNFEVVYVP